MYLQFIIPLPLYHTAHFSKDAKFDIQQLHLVMWGHLSSRTVSYQMLDLRSQILDIGIPCRIVFQVFTACKKDVVVLTTYIVVT